MARKQWLSVGELTLEGYVNGDGVTVFAENASQLAILCGKAGAPTSYTGAGYAIGCHYINATNGALYYNAGTATVASWSAIGTMTTSSVTTAMVQANAVTPIKMGTRTLVALSDGAATPTTAQLMTSSVFTMTPGAARTFTTPTAATMVGAITGATVGTWFDFTIVNLAQFPITLTAGDASVTLVGDAVVNKGAGTFRAILTNVTGGTEALSIYRTDGALVAGDIPLANGTILVGNASGIAAAVTPSNDLTMSNAGAFTLAYPKVTAIVSQALVYSAFTDNTNTTGYIDITTQIPAHSIVLGWKAVITTGFTGDPATATVQVGISGGVGNFSATTSGSVYTSSTEVGSASAVATSYCAAATTARVTVTSAADFTSVSAGSMVVTLYIVRTA
jgi:hypothetical protein